MKVLIVHYDSEVISLLVDLVVSLGMGHRAVKVVVTYSDAKRLIDIYGDHLDLIFLPEEAVSSYREPGLISEADALQKMLSEETVCIKIDKSIIDRTPGPGRYNTLALFNNNCKFTHYRSEQLKKEIFNALKIPRT